MRFSVARSLDSMRSVAQQYAEVQRQGLARRVGGCNGKIAQKSVDDLLNELLLRSDDFIKTRDRKTRSSNCSQCGSRCLLRPPVCVAQDIAMDLLRLHRQLGPHRQRPDDDMLHFALFQVPLPSPEPPARRRRLRTKTPPEKYWAKKRPASSYGKPSRPGKLSSGEGVPQNWSASSCG